MTIRTGCGAFEIDPSGRVRRTSHDPSPVPQGASWWPYTGIWDKLEAGHLVIGRWQRTLWRSSGRFHSRGRFPSADVGALTVGPAALAFTYGSRPQQLFIAARNGREHLVASGEYPLGWTSGGLYTRRTRYGELLLRHPSGRLAATIARQVYRYYAYDRRDGSLYFIAHGTLFRAQGATIRRLTPLSRVGLAPHGTFQLAPLGGLVDAQNAHRLAVLRPDGSLLASIPLPSRKTRVDGTSNTPTAAPDRSTVAFTATRGNSAYGSTGTESVYLIRPSATSAQPIHRERVHFAVCERGSTLAWHGHWLLYSTSEGNLSLIDTSRSHHAIDLAATLRRLPGTSGDQGHLDFTAYWTGDPTGL